MYYFMLDGNSFESIRDAIIVYVRASPLKVRSKKLACIYPPKEVLATGFDAHFYCFLSATTNEATHVVFVITEAPFLQLRTKYLRRGPRGWSKCLLLKSSA